MKTETEINISDLLKRIIAEMVGHPEKIEIEESFLGRTVLWKIKVHPEDMSRVIGKRGVNVVALKRLATEMGRCSGSGVHCSAEVQQYSESTVQPHLEFEGKKEWNSANITKIASEIADIILDSVGEIEIIDGPDFKSVLQINLGAREASYRLTNLTDILRPIFVAIGKANGRHLMIDLVPYQPFL